MKSRERQRERAKLGRPPKPRNEVRSERVVSFVTPSEFDRLLEVADERGESVSAAIHRILRSALLKQNVEEKGLQMDTTKNELIEQGE